MMTSFFKEIRSLRPPEKIFWIGWTLICGVFYYLIISQSPHWVRNLFNQDQFYLLNFITDTNSNQDLAYYLARCEEALWGPLGQIVSGLFFTAFAVRFLKDTKIPGFWLATLVYLIMTKFEVLFFPPYGDAIGGPFAEGIWLAQNNFDYLGLIHQPSYYYGGPRVYTFSIFPTFLAIGLKLISSRVVFLCLYHLFIFAASALVVAQLKNICERFFSREVSVLSALTLLFMTTYQSQTEAINMEIPCLFFVMLSAIYLLREKLFLASLWAVLAALAKGTGILACWVIGVVSFIELFSQRPWKDKVRFILAGLIAVLFSVLMVLSKYILRDQHVAQGMLNFFVGWFSLKQMPTFFYFFYSFGIFLLYGVGKVLFDKVHVTDQWRKNYYAAFIIFLFGVMWFVLFLNFSVVSYRYRIVAYPFMVFGWVYVMSLFIRWENLRRIALVVVIILSLLGSYGYFHGTMPQNDHVFLERSLEYRTDLKLNQRFVELLERKYQNFLIVAPFTIAQMLAIPELCYVQQGFEVMIYGFPCTYGGIKNYAGLINLPLRRTIFIGVRDLQATIMDGQLAYPIGPQDQVIEDVRYGNKKISIFVGGHSIEACWRAQFLRQNSRLLKKNSP